MADQVYRNGQGNGSLPQNEYNGFENGREMNDSGYQNGFGNSYGPNTYANSGNTGRYGNTYEQNMYGNRNSQNGYGNVYGQNAYGNRNGQGGYGNAYGRDAYGNQNGQSGYGNAYGQNAYGNQNGQSGYGNAYDSNAFGNLSNQGGYGDAADQGMYGNPDVWKTHSQEQGITYDDLTADEQVRKRQMLRRKRRQEAEIRRRRQLRKMRMTIGILAAAVVGCVAIGSVLLIGRDRAAKAEAAAASAQSIKAQDAGSAASENDASQAQTETSANTDSFTIQETDSTQQITSETVESTNAVLIRADTGDVIAEKEADEVINPASMTKILTVLTAVDHIKDLSDTYTITQDVTDYSYTNEASIVGFDVNETVTVQDLLYGTILQSGADAAYALALYVSGSQDAFVEQMNAKAQELGLSATARFSNCVGLYDENNHCTVKDMAIILKNAEENELLNKVLNTRTYTTSKTPQHPDGIEVSNWFLRRIEDKDIHGTIQGAKTGYVAQAGSCAASYMLGNDGNPYICVSVHASSAWRCIYDQVEIYDTYIPAGNGDESATAVSAGSGDENMTSVSAESGGESTAAVSAGSSDENKAAAGSSTESLSE